MPKCSSHKYNTILFPHFIYYFMNNYFRGLKIQFFALKDDRKVTVFDLYRIAPGIDIFLLCIMILSKFDKGILLP